LRVFKTSWFIRFARKERITAQPLLDAIKRAANGQIDADLGGGVIKQRLARPGEGRSKGYRSIILFRREDRAFFVYGFSKSEQGNISENEEVQFKKMAKYTLALSDVELEALIAQGQFEEVLKDD